MRLKKAVVMATGIAVDNLEKQAQTFWTLERGKLSAWAAVSGVQKQWLSKRLEKNLAIDEWQRDELRGLLNLL